MRLHAVALLFVCLVSCGSVPKAPLQLDAAAKDFTPPSGLARIYVYRLGSPWLSRHDSQIWVLKGSVDDSFWELGKERYLGRISKARYVFADVPAGRHTIVAVTRGRDDEGHIREIAQGELALETVADTAYFVRVEVPKRWPVDPPRIELVNSVEGSSAVTRCWLARR